MTGFDRSGGEMSETSQKVKWGRTALFITFKYKLANEFSGTTGTQTFKYLGTESSPWSGLLGLHLTVTTVARPSSQEVVAVEDLIRNRKKNVRSVMFPLQ